MNKLGIAAIAGGAFLASNQGKALISKFFSKSSGGNTAVTFDGKSTISYKAQLKFPSEYATQFTQGGQYEQTGNGISNGAIIFPYTPTISYDVSASYNPQAILHSNYPMHSYKSSSVSNISLSAKWSVQNNQDAELYLAVVHLLKALTKMRVGDDPNAGSPPPICKLYAYGDDMINDVPVVLTSFKIDLPDNVDYYQSATSIVKPSENDYSPNFGKNLIPTLSTFSMSFLPMYSRAEMFKYNVPDWLAGKYRSSGGYI
jgi:hypothetical protein